MLKKVEGAVVKGEKEVSSIVQIAPPNIRLVKFRLIGNAPLVMNNFSTKMREQMKQTQVEGSTTRKGKKREGKDFEALYKGAMHISRDGWIGIPATAFRNALIRACSIVDFKMTLAKLSLFVEADGFDAGDGTPLVRITKGKPHPVEHCVRNANGSADIRCRPMWDEWEAMLRMKYDADQFTVSDVTNLIHRVGLQVGILEGRPSSKNSGGMGWGTFDIAGV
jgi:hypothetical protein